MSVNLDYNTIDPKKRTVIMVGLAIALFAACFDGTVTTTCGPTIATQFSANDMLPWLTTGYLLLETITIPLSGKLSDLYGRKKLLIVGLTLFGLASLLAGIAWDMWVVILARALQGAGGGILIPVATAAVSDLYAPEDRGKIQGVLGALFGIGMGAGPLIGGYFAGLGDLGLIHGWQLAFLINIPVVLLVIALCRHEFPVVTCEGKPKIDYMGVALISIALVGIVVYFQCLGKQFNIESAESILFVSIIVLVLCMFSYVEHNADEPIMAPHVFQNPTVRAAAVIFFLLGFALVGDELFTGLYLQKVTGHSPTEAGLYLLCMVVGMIIASVAGGSLINKTGTKPLIVSGTLLMALGFFGLSYIEPTFNDALFIGAEFIFGLGAGLLLASLMTTVQNSCEHKDVGMTTSAVNLMRNVGSTIGTSIFTLLVSAMIFEEANNKGEPYNQFADLGLGILDKLGNVPPAIAAGIKEIFTNSVAAAFFFGALLLLIAVIVAFRFKVVTLEQSKKIQEYTAELTKDNKKL